MSAKEAKETLNNTAWLGTEEGIRVYPAVKAAVTAIDKVEMLEKAKGDLKDLYLLLQKHLLMWNPTEEHTELEKVGIEIQALGLQTIDYVLGVLEEVKG